MREQDGKAFKRRRERGTEVGMRSKVGRSEGAAREGGRRGAREGRKEQGMDEAEWV